MNKHWDGDKAKVDQERENVEHEQPLEENEIGEDAAAKLATDLFHDALPQFEGLPGRPHTVAAPAEKLKKQPVLCTTIYIQSELSNAWYNCNILFL